MLIPVQAAYLPVKGLQQLIKTILTVKKRLNRKLAIEGILLTMVDFRTNYARDIASRVHTTYRSQIEVFENVIPMSVKAAETSACLLYTSMQTHAASIHRTDAGTSPNFYSLRALISRHLRKLAMLRQGAR